MDTQQDMQPTVQTPETQVTPETTKVNSEINLYPILRTVLISVCVLIALGFVLFLIYQNGRSIYANGL